MRRESADDATLMRRATPPGDGPVASANDDAAPDIAPADSVVPVQNQNALPGDDAPLAPGERVGPYEVREHIGDGGMASVYRAWHTGLHRFEALKIPRQQGRYGPEAAFVRRLLTEARTVAGLHHPNIALIHAVSEADSPLQYFAMELVEGGDLAELIQTRGKIPPAAALPILKQIADALDYAHGNGVVHRDIKPANVLLTADGTAKVVDFGISRAGEEAGGTRLTRSGMIVGTPEYMSPEQSGSGDPVTHLTDVYSLGVVAYEMLCGVPPFVAGEGVSRLSILMKHLGEAPASPLRSIPGFGPAATEALLTALAKKPEERFVTCGEFVAALGRAIQKRGHTQILAGPGNTPSDGAGAERPLTRSLRERTAEAVQPESPEPAPRRAVFVPRPVSRKRPGALITAVSALSLGILVLLGWWQRNAPEPAVPPAKAAKTALASGGVAPAVPGHTPAASPNHIAPKASARIVVRTVTRHNAIAFKRLTRHDASLPLHTKRVVQHGQNGVWEASLEVRSKGLHILSRRLLASRVLRAPVDEITALGTEKSSSAPKPQPHRPTPVAKASKARAPKRIVPRPPKPHHRAVRHPARPRRVTHSRPRRRFGREAPLPP